MSITSPRLEPHVQSSCLERPVKQLDEKLPLPLPAATKEDLEAVTASPHHLSSHDDPIELDTHGRRPLRLGGSEEAWVLGALFASSVSLVAF